MIQFFLGLVPEGEKLFFHSFQDFYLLLVFFVCVVIVPVVAVVHTVAVAVAVHVTAVVVVCWFLELQFLEQISFFFFCSGGAVKTTLV